jgi:hypothetical protein
MLEKEMKIEGRKDRREVSKKRRDIKEGGKKEGKEERRTSNASFLIIPKASSILGL